MLGFLLYAEEGIDKTLFVERNEATLLLICKEVLSRNSG